MEEITKRLDSIESELKRIGKLIQALGDAGQQNAAKIDTNMKEEVGKLKKEIIAIIGSR